MEGNSSLDHATAQLCLKMRTTLLQSRRLKGHLPKTNKKNIITKGRTGLLHKINITVFPKEQ